MNESDILEMAYAAGKPIVDRLIIENPGKEKEKMYTVYEVSPLFMEAEIGVSIPLGYTAKDKLVIRTFWRSRMVLSSVLIWIHNQENGEYSWSSILKKWLPAESTTNGKTTQR